MTRFASVALLGLLILAYKPGTRVDKAELQQIFKTIIDADSVKSRYYIIDSIQEFYNKSITQSGVTYSIAENDIINTGTWAKEIFDHAEIISGKYLDSISRNNPYKTAPHYNFSLPYFSKDKKSFIIYYSYYCGSLCAEYSLRLYKRINGKWVYVKSFFTMVS